MKPTTIKLALIFLLSWLLPLVLAGQGWAQLQSWCSQPKEIKTKLTTAQPSQKEAVVKCGITAVPALTEILKDKDESIRKEAASTNG
jgi:hypothetical protein